MATNHAYYQKIILDSVEEDYDGNQLNTPKEKVKFLSDRFNSEYGHEVKRFGQQKAMVNWLQGLAIDIPFYNSDIIEVAKKGGSLPENATEKQEDKVVENYWNFMANETLKLFRKYKV